VKTFSQDRSGVQLLRAMNSKKSLSEEMLLPEVRTTKDIRCIFPPSTTSVGLIE